ETKLAFGSQDRSLADAFDQPLSLAAIVDQIGDRTDLEAMQAGEVDEVSQARHRAVVFEDFADHRGRRQACELRQVTTGLGVAGPDQHAARLRHDWKNVSGLDDVLRAGARCTCDPDRVRAIRSGYPCRNTFGRLDR